MSGRVVGGNKTFWGGERGKKWMEVTFSACLSVQLISARFTCLPTFRTTGLPVRSPNTRPVRSLRHQLNKTTAKEKNYKKNLTCCVESRETQFRVSRWSVSEAGDSKMFHPAFWVANTSNSVTLNSVPPNSPVPVGSHVSLCGESPQRWEPLIHRWARCVCLSKRDVRRHIGGANHCNFEVTLKAPEC